MQEPRWHPYSTTLPIVWRLIERNPGCAVCDLMRWTGMPRASIDKALRNLIKQKLVHISGYQRFEKTGSGMARQFTVGEGENLPRPRIHVHTQRKAHREKSKFNKRQRTIARKGVEGGVFGFMAAQIHFANLGGKS